jgi:hypothetical protein
MAYSPDQGITKQEQSASSGQTVLAKQDNSAPTLSVILTHLPQQYVRALMKPSIETYTQSNPGWSLVWVQLLVWGILDAILGVMVNLISPPATGTTFLQLFTLASSFGLVVVVPVLFFLLMGIVYLLARAFGGQGTFLEQCNASLSIQVPLGIFSKLLALIPVVGRILNIVPSVYGIVLQVFVIIAVHRLSKGKATAVILIPLVTLGVLAGAIFLLARK